MTTAALILAIAYLANGYLTRRSNERTADRAEVAAREASQHAMTAGSIANTHALWRN